MAEWWHQNVTFPVYAHDWWFVGSIIGIFVWAIWAMSFVGNEEEKKEQRLLDIERLFNAYPAAQKMAEALERVQQRHDQGIPFGSGNDVAMVEEALTLWQQVTQEDK